MGLWKLALRTDTRPRITSPNVDQQHHDTMNTELLIKVKAAILAEPRKFDMRDWFVDDTQSPCGTAACIAGHALTISIGAKSLKDGQRHWLAYLPNTTQIIGCGWEQKDRLCYVEQWPSPFREQYRSSDSRQERAKIAAARIDFFIATNGTDQESVPAVCSNENQK